MTRSKVLIGLSGGVDSSVAAALLKEKGHDVIGVTLKLYDYETVGFDPQDDACCSLNMVEDARSVCNKLGIPHYVIDMRKQFENMVVKDFVEQYLIGRTPNPCINCNRFIKWGEMLKTAEVLNCEFIATGHYARIVAVVNRLYLCKANDSAKDQSYALWGIPKNYLGKTMFPNGGFLKSEIRELAAKFGFRNADRPESQEICFVPDGHYGNLLKLKKSDTQTFKEGPIYDLQGNQVGIHKGYVNYTIGQRRGLGISSPRPLYVTKINAQDNSLTVGAADDLLAHRLTANNLNYLIGPEEIPVNIKVKIRYKHNEAAARVENITNDSISVYFESPQRAITPGQSAVLYDGDRVIGGGIIDSIGQN